VQIQVCILQVVAVRDPVRYKKTTQVRRRWLAAAGLAWLLALASAAILLPPVIGSWPFPDRYSCQVSNDHIHSRASKSRQ